MSLSFSVVSPLCFVPFVVLPIMNESHTQTLSSSERHALAMCEFMCLHMHGSGGRCVARMHTTVQMLAQREHACSTFLYGYV